MMTNIYILDRNLVPIGLTDEFISLIWTTRFNKVGDFELVLPVTVENINLFKQDRYLRYEEDDEYMLINEVNIQTDVEEGTSLFITGNTVGIVLDRRVIHPMTTLNGSARAGIKKLLDTHILSPAIAERRWDQLNYVDITDPEISNGSVEAQYTGDSLLGAIEDLCGVIGLGFKVLYNPNIGFDFVLYTGKELSGEVPVFQTVTFSPDYENLSNSTFISNNLNHKTVTVVGGEGEGPERKYLTVYSDSSAKGLDRRELFTDARDISSDVDGVKLTTTQYNNLLKQRGNEKLKEYEPIIFFDGEADPKGIFKYGSDFNTGDIVRIANEFGMSGRSRVVEYIRSEGVNGKAEYPTFAIV